MSIRNEVWLGGENVLGLGPDTDGAAARYDVGGSVARLLLIDYPSATRAEEALNAVEGGKVEGVLVAATRGRRLGVVLGEASPSAAHALLEQALQSG